MLETLPQDLNPRLHTWTRQDFARMAEAGLFANMRVQLIEGHVVEMSPMKSRHATALNLAILALTPLLDASLHLRTQQPLALNSISEPEPDIAVVSGSIRDYGDEHPTTALLVVEVSDSTLRFDRQVKGSLYAKAGLREYWIVNLVAGCLEVYELPIADPEADYGYRYSQCREFRSGDWVAVNVAAGRPLAVADMLP